MDSNTNAYSVSIIGSGKVGRALCRFLPMRGVGVDSLVTNHREESASLAEQFDGIRIREHIEEMPKKSDFLLICVPDNRISKVALQIHESNLDLSGKIIAHTSGLRTSEELDVLRIGGALYGSIHPAQSFHTLTTDPGILEGIGCGIEGSETFSVRAKEFAEAIGWKPILIRKENKPMYHAACVFAGNFLVALAEDAGTILKRAASSDVEMNHLLPMMEAVLHRLHNTPIHEAVTGPASRGDDHTTAIHMETLGELPEEFRMIYALWTKRILDITGANEDTLQRMHAALHPPEND